MRGGSRTVTPGARSPEAGRSGVGGGDRIESVQYFTFYSSELNIIRNSFGVDLNIFKCVCFFIF